VARALMPLIAQIRPTILAAVGPPPFSLGQRDPGAVAVGYASSACGTGISVGWRTHAQTGMISIDVEWLQEIIAQDDIDQDKNRFRMISDN